MIYKDQALGSFQKRRGLLAVMGFAVFSLLSSSAMAHVEYYDLNQGAQIGDLTAAGVTKSTAQYGNNPVVDNSAYSTSPLLQGSDRPLNNTAYWNSTYQSYTGVGSFSNVSYSALHSSANVAVNDVTAFGWGDGTTANLGDSHKVDFFNFRLAQTSTVTITWNVSNSAGNYFDSGISLFGGVMNYQSHDDASADPLNPLDPNSSDNVQSVLDTGSVKDAQGIASATRDTVNNPNYAGQFDALHNWGDANASGYWSNIDYLASVNNAVVAGNTKGFSKDANAWKETLTLTLAAGNYTIAASGATGAQGSGIPRSAATGLTGNLTFVADALPAAVPVPGAVWLFGSALMAMLGLRRKAC